MNNPTISIVIPTYNEEENIEKCLKSIFSQSYPLDRVEVIVIDDNSTDKTIEIAKKYPVKILTSGKRHGEISKMLGFKKSKGKYFMYLDADNELIGNKWFQQMLRPLEEDRDIIGVFTWEGARKTDSAIERFLSFDPLQRDSLYQFFSPSITSVIQQKKQGYWLLNYTLGKVPPAGRCLYRREQVKKIFNSYEMFLELDFLVLLVKSGYTKFAYAYNAGLYHHHAKSLRELLRKRRYNLTKVYFAHVQNKLYTWFNLRNPFDVIKMLVWILWANLIIPSVVIGVYKSIKYKDLAGLYEPLVNILVTDMLLLSAVLDRRIFSLVAK